MTLFGQIPLCREDVWVVAGRGSKPLYRVAAREERKKEQTSCMYETVAKVETRPAHKSKFSIETGSKRSVGNLDAVGSSILGTS